MTPILPYRNILTGASVPDYEREAPDTGAADRLRGLSLFTSARRESETMERDLNAERLMVHGFERHRDAIVGSIREVDLTRLEEMRAGFVAAAHGGDRASYFNALQNGFVLVHYSLDDPNGRARSSGYVTDFVELSREYAEFLRNNTALTPAEKFRFLFAAAQIGRTLLGRLESEESPLPNAAELTAGLRSLLVDLYGQLERIHEAMLTLDPSGEPFTGILLQVRMRHALAEGEVETARQRALELARYYEQHPPPAAESEDPDRNRWDHVAARAMVRDGEFVTLLGGMDISSPAEDTSATLNGLSYELLQILASTIDAVNEEDEADIRARYLSLSAAVTTLSLTRPGLTLQQILETLADEEAADGILADMRAAGEAHESLATLLTQARGEGDLNDLIVRARAAAGHVLVLNGNDGHSLHLNVGLGGRPFTLNVNAGRSLFEPVFSQNAAGNPIARMAELLEGQGELAASLRLTADTASPLPANVQWALQLLRRGESAIEPLRAFGNSHPAVNVEEMVGVLDDPGSTQASVNALIEHLLETYQTDLSSQPDHVIAAIHSVLQAIGETEEIAAGVSLSEELRTRAVNGVEAMNGTWFQTERALRHVFLSPSGLPSLVAGMLVSEMLPAMFLARASATGRRTVAGIEVVSNLGRLTFAGHTMTGLGTGLSMSVIGTSINTYERDSMGLTTHFGRDLAISSAVNTFTFAATVPFSRYYGRWLTPNAAEATATGRLTGLNRFYYHAGVTAFGTGIALLTNATMRWGMGGEFNISYQEFAENILSMLIWEAGSAGIRRVRQHYGLNNEIRGEDPIHLVPPDPSAPVLSRFGRVLGGVLVRPANFFLRSLGRQRAARVAEVSDRIVREMISNYERNRGPEDPDVVVPENIRSHRFWDLIARQIAVQEIVAPESLDQYHDAFFALHEPRIAGDAGSYHLVFVPRRPTLPEFIGFYAAPREPAAHFRAPPPAREIPADPSAVEPGREAPAPRPEPPPRPPRARVRVAETVVARPEPRPAESAPVAAGVPSVADRMRNWTAQALESAFRHPSTAERIEFLRRHVLRHIQGDANQPIHEVPVEFYPDTGIFGVTPREEGTRTFPGEPTTMVPMTGRFDPHQMTLRLPPFHGTRGPIEINLETGGYRTLPPPPPPAPPPGGRPPSGGGESGGSPPESGSRGGPPPPPQPPPPPPGPREARRRHGVMEIPAVPPQVFGMTIGEPAARPPVPPAAERPADPVLTGPGRPRHDVLEMPVLSSHTMTGMQPELFVLEPGHSVTAIGENRSPSEPRRDQHFFAVPQGEVFAFTEVGFDKHTGRLGHGINEDAYGIAVDAAQRTVLMAADGMGGYGGGDIASSRAIRTVLDAVHRGGAASLAQSFLDAHSAIGLETPRGATCATACRVNADGTVEVAQAGDTMVYVLRRDAQRGHRILRAFLPGNGAGDLRGRGLADLRTTAAMNASQMAHQVTGGLGRGVTPTVTHDLHHGVPHGIYEGLLTLPNESNPAVREILVLRPGDGLLLVSDGIGDIFDSAQLGATTGEGRGLTQAMGENLYTETMRRLDLYVRARLLPGDSRLTITDGGFRGNFIDNQGNVYNAASGGDLIGHIHGDNITGVLFRFLGLGHLPPRGAAPAGE